MALPMVPMLTRGKSSQQRAEENKDEHVSESYLNKLVGAAEVYDLEVRKFSSLTI